VPRIDEEIEDWAELDDDERDRLRRLLEDLGLRVGDPDGDDAYFE
jgi:hypothetical protein